MATKLNMLKLLQETRELAEFTNRRPPPRTPGLFLLQLRSHLLHAVSIANRRTISIDMQALPEAPLPIKIKHQQAAPAALASSPAL